MDPQKANRLIEEKMTEESLRSEFEATVQNRVRRYLDVKPHEISPNQHFAAVSDECAKLYRDGHFYGGIALTQAVVEAVVRFLCQRNQWRPNKSFESNVRKLETRNIITSELVESLLRIWEDRDDFHHLNPAVERDRRKLAELAREKAQLLAEVERDVFEYQVNDGRLAPKNPQYWDIEGDLAQVFLRFE